MPASPPITRHPSGKATGKTFLVASTLLGMAALGLIATLILAVVDSSRGKKPRAKDLPEPTSTAQAEAPNGKLATGALPAEALAISDPLAEPMPQSAAEPIAPAAPILPPEKPIPVLASKPIPKAAPESRYQELVEQGKTLRDRGDMPNALTKLREAQTLEPENPAAVAEIAVSYEKMGLMEKASEQWKRIHEMGQRRAGSYYIAADARLKQSQTQAMMTAQAAQYSNGAAAPEATASAILTISPVTTEEINDPLCSQKFTLRVPLKIQPNTKINVADLTIQVLFYDSVEGKALVQTNANVNSRWASPPTDWVDSDTELLEIEYSQPRADPKESRREERKYFGYIVRVYYKNELQDTRAEPRSLAAKFAAPQALEKSPIQ